MSKVFTAVFYTEDGRSTSVSLGECIDKNHAAIMVHNLLNTTGTWIKFEDGAIRKSSVCSFGVIEEN